MKVVLDKKVFVNGTFDILHRGHLELLNYAKSLGYVIVGIDTDECVRGKKGPTRPIHNQEERKFLLENLKSVDEVIFFSSEPEFEELIKSLHPDIIIVGSDWKEKSTINSYYDGELIFFDRREDYSTTKTLRRIDKRNEKSHSLD
jgi:D-beta-D-heptose 7-phosphate kinase/D-beta-D-heptose 1-phosphate adenosyltransferase|tara:strand:- start:152 stop:586 length:435 start_codon:yes stop_codon:yes gene_type:complete